VRSAKDRSDIADASALAFAASTPIDLFVSYKDLPVGQLQNWHKTGGPFNSDYNLSTIACNAIEPLCMDFGLSGERSFPLRFPANRF